MADQTRLRAAYPNHANAVYGAAGKPAVRPSAKPPKTPKVYSRLGERPGPKRTVLG